MYGKYAPTMPRGILKPRKIVPGDVDDGKEVTSFSRERTFHIDVEKRDIDHIYYNASYTNASDIPSLASIIDTRSSAIMDRPEEFEMSIVRFDVDAQTIPITIIDVISPAVVNPAAPGNLTSVNMWATLRNGGVDNSTLVVITPASSSVQLPLGSIFNFQKLLDDINAAFATSYGLISVKPAGSAPPQFIWDPVTQLIDLWVDPSYQYGTAVPPFTGPTTEIWVSFALWAFLTGFDNYQNGYDRADHKDVRIEVRQTSALVQPASGSRYGIPYSLASAPTNLLRVRQEATQTQNWNVARSLQITSSLLPVLPEYVPASLTANDNAVTSATQRIVSDFLIPTEDNVMTSRNVFQYLPTAEYRMIDLNGKAPLLTIDLTFNWTDYLGNLYPLYLNPGASVSVKILFRRKGVTD
jgi:hypothetical protein